LSPLDESEVSFDANVATDFELTGNASLLQQLFPERILVSDIVKAELGEAEIAFTVARVIQLNEEHLSLLDQLRSRNPRLGLGEIGAIAVAHVRHAVLASNDGHARSAATEIGLAITGSLGILEHAVSSGSVEAVKAVSIAENMILAGAWFSEELIELFRARVLA
jgi:predicted nucleic acid-binding protein